MASLPHADELSALLSAAGYQIIFRPHGEVLIHRAGERWYGHGECKEKALAAAFEQMLPSHLARELFTRRHRSRPATAAESPPPETRDIQSAPEVIPATPPPPAPTPPSPPSPPVMMGDTPKPPAPVESEAERRKKRDEVLTKLAAILNGIEEQLPLFARLAPDRQRLFMLIWLCRARAGEEALPDDAEVKRRAGKIARRLTDLAKTFWPGSVRALQLTARPSDVPELRVKWAKPVRTWVEAEALADRVLGVALTEADKEGLDADGWIKDPPNPQGEADPDATLTAAVRVIDGVRAAEDPATGTPKVDDPTADALLAAARKLRRVRGRVKDHVAWGLAMGQLRRLTPALGKKSAKMRDTIDPRTPRP